MIRSTRKSVAILKKNTIIQWSCCLMHHVLDHKVGGSNPGESMSFSPGRRLDLLILWDQMNNGGVTN